MGTYVLITPVRDEEEFVRFALDSVVAQTRRPERWVIVDDASRDTTAAVLEQHARGHDFIRIVRIADRGDRNFARKAQAFKRGLEELRDCDYDFIGNLDGDISLASDYYARVLAEFDLDPRLGIAGGIVYTNVAGRFETTDETLDSVGGAVQLFRRPCFEAVGGYPALRRGGIDAAAEITARMRGWRVRKCLDLQVLEHRRTGSAECSPLRARFREGRRFQSLGYDPLFYVARSLYRIANKPMLVGSLAGLAGFLAGSVTRRSIALGPDVVEFLRHEQRAKLRQMMRGSSRRHTTPSPPETAASRSFGSSDSSANGRN
jgi:biofilm PGA synthesis N-glycosyltransferase PgaC